MKLFARCSRCYVEQSEPAVFVTADLRNDGIHEATCVNGHRTFMVLQNPHYELLMDSGGLALRDEYCREAVASFAAALESFWGFYVRVAARKLGAPVEHLDRLRKDVRLAERRRGAMWLARLLLVGQPYKPGDETERVELGKRTPTKFRNDVVHEGEFPPQSAATAYGAWVYDTILDGQAELKTRAPAELDAEGLRDVAARHKEAFERDQSASRPTTWNGSLLWRGQRSPRPTFEVVFADWKQLNSWDLAEAPSEVMHAIAQRGEEPEPARDGEGQIE